MIPNCLLLWAYRTLHFSSPFQMAEAEKLILFNELWRKVDHFWAEAVKSPCPILQSLFLCPHALDSTAARRQSCYCWTTWEAIALESQSPLPQYHTTPHYQELEVNFLVYVLYVKHWDFRVACCCYITLPIMNNRLTHPPPTRKCRLLYTCIPCLWLPFQLSFPLLKQAQG